MRELPLYQKFMKCLISWFLVLAIIIAGVWFFSAERALAPVGPDGLEIIPEPK